MTATARIERLERVRDALAARGADWLIVPASADFRWLTGAPARATERLVAFALPREGAPFCIVPRLESEALAQAAPWLDLEVWDEDDDPLARLGLRIGLERRPNILLGEGFRTGPLLTLAAAAACGAAGPLLAPLRAVKGVDEIERMQRAARNADRVVEEAADLMRPGMTERQVARFALERLVDLGDTDPWVIVASGPNSAHPHHMTSTRVLADGDVVILDLGAYTEGYGSDITRTYWIGDPPSEAVKVYEVVNRARAAGVAAVRDGAIPEQVDGAGRSVIEEAGYGAFFIHRIGHGVGLEVHEPPFLVKGSRAPLRTGMTHSVEPGIYLPGRFGVRIEDLVVVEESRARLLNDAPRDPRPPRLRR